MAAKRYVYDFDEPSEGGRELLGGKGVGLAEMTQLGVPVPAGFTVTTDACRAYMESGKELPEGLEEEIEEHLAALEERTGKRFGDSEDPLLVSVRSGAAVSMPGMMDTILNLGLNDEAVEGLARQTENPRFAHDSYRRLIQMYGEVVEADAARLPFEDASLPLVVSFNSLMDMDDAAVAVREAARVLEPGGRFCAAIVHPFLSAGDGEPLTIRGSYLEPRRLRGPLARGDFDLETMHRPLSWYSDAVFAAGLLVESLREVPGVNRPHLPISLHVLAVKS